MFSLFIIIVDYLDWKKYVKIVEFICLNFFICNVSCCIVGEGGFDIRINIMVDFIFCLWKEIVIGIIVFFCYIFC